MYVNSRKQNHTKEYGDFQTPSVLAEEVIKNLKGKGISPSSILEPTCGTGAFILVAAENFPDVKKIYGFDINKKYLAILRKNIVKLKKRQMVTLENTDFFQKNWKEFLSQLAKPILIIGNLPWITSSTQGLINGKNLPKKSNIHGFKGLDSLTGKSNFDISEWMILQLLGAMNESTGTLAMLCKVSVARKIFEYIHTHDLPVSSYTIHRIDALTHFEASIDACLLTCIITKGYTTKEAHFFPSLNAPKPSSTLGIIDKLIINDMSTFRETQFLHGKFSVSWRSGVKHDAAQIMILKKDEDSFINGLNKRVIVEDTYLYPHLKSTDLVHNRVDGTHRWLIVPQKSVGEDTKQIRKIAPKTWDYLYRNRALLDNRKSSIYKGKPSFSVFGVGHYTFTNWKIGISGLHKHLNFVFIGPIQNKPVVLDDTSYLLPMESKEEALFFYSLLTHPIASKFLNSIIYWNAKRPISQKILRQLNIPKITQKISLKYILETVESLNIGFDEQKLEGLYQKYT